MANSGQINILENTVVLFAKHSAMNGGALALLWYSVMELHPGSQVVFELNHAHELGGAIYATSGHQSDFILSHKCFISFNGMNSNDPDMWNVALIFTNNSARYDYAIFTDSVFHVLSRLVLYPQTYLLHFSGSPSK